MLDASARHAPSKLVRVAFVFEPGTCASQGCRVTGSNLGQYQVKTPGKLGFLLGSGAGDRTWDLRLMSPTL